VFYSRRETRIAICDDLCTDQATRRFLWIPMDSYGFLWISMESYGFLWISAEGTAMHVISLHSAAALFTQI
jgi:hypothetical protein